MVSVFAKLLLQWKASDPASDMLPGLREKDTHSKAMVDWDGSQGSGLCSGSAILKLGNPTIQLSRVLIS